MYSRGWGFCNSDMGWSGRNSGNTTFMQLPVLLRERRIRIEPRDARGKCLITLRVMFLMPLEFSEESEG